MDILLISSNTLVICLYLIFLEMGQLFVAVFTELKTVWLRRRQQTANFLTPVRPKYGANMAKTPYRHSRSKSQDIFRFPRQSISSQLIRNLAELACVKTAYLVRHVFFPLSELSADKTFLKHKAQCGKALLPLVIFF